MTPLLIRKFNELTNGEFDYIKLTEVNVYVKSQRIEVYLIYPEEKRSDVISATKKIILTIKSIINSQADIDVILTMSHFDLEFFKKDFIEFFKVYPSISALINVNNLSSTKNNNEVEVRLKLPETACEYIKDKGVDKALNEFLYNSYCENIRFYFDPIEEIKEKDEIDEFLEEVNEPEITLVLERPDGRYITPENVEEFIGNIIYDKATYACDVPNLKETAVVCGEIYNWQELRRKPKEGETEGKPFYKFTLKDYTGEVKCLIFPRSNNIEKINMLKNGKQVVVRGDIKESTFKGETTHDIFVRDLSLCTLPSDFTENKFVHVVEKEYKTVFPKPYVELEQVNLFAPDKEVAPYLKGKTFVVFDLESTGLSPTFDKIIEIAAFKIVDGVIKEDFSTFVNPGIAIPQRITDLTSITDDDVANAPTIEEVLPDFQKFADGSILVGHNIANFDLPLLNHEGEPFHIRFNHHYEDTFPISKTYIKGLKNNKLGTVAAYFGIVNEHAHRAYYDTLVNAKVFLKLAEFMS
ncbi:MAG: hypothetical protein E7353_00535 [Clostridiales bacterium]|nr:hypothetical protein [Clostridiales bacterium]